VPHDVCEAVTVAGVADLGVPVPGGVAVSAAGWADLGAPGFAGAALAVGAGRAAGAGVPAGVEVVDAAALGRGAGLAGVEAPLLCAGLALDSDCAGFGAAEPPPPDPLEGELEDAAGLGALELPELEPLSEDDFAAAGFGAGELPPELPEGPPATLATVRTATVEDANPGVVTEEVVLAFVDKSSVPNIHTSATAPRSTDTDPARHSRTNTATSTRTGIARDTVSTGTGGTTHTRRPPAEATDIITNAPRGCTDTATVSFLVPGRLSDREGEE
jgi:hypothetical protein